MEVILLERVEKLGLMGDIVNVKPGYARNFLLPRNKAISATPTNKKEFENKRVQFEATNLETKKEAQTIGSKLDGEVDAMIRQAGESGQLYGSVNARDVADGLIQSGYKINRRQVSLERPIKAVGLHSIKITLHPEVIVTVTANVARSDDEAKLQEKTGEAIITVENDEKSQSPDEVSNSVIPEDLKTSEVSVENNKDENQTSEIKKEPVDGEPAIEK